MIIHNQFSKTVQSLGYVPEGKEKSTFTVGIVEPGRQEFPTATREEVIEVTKGHLIINGELYFPDDDGYTVHPGEKVAFETDCPSSYICHFPDEPADQ